jgi:hypothetical protein
MAGPANMNYDSLVADIQAYTERTNDSSLNTQIPRLIMMAENRIATDARILGTREIGISTFTAGEPIVPKPAYWRRTESLNYTDSANGRTQILPRSLEFCRDYWPSPAATGSPRYYADYDFDNLLIVATPAAALPFELVYIARIPPLSSSNQTNWLTANAPQLLLNACLLEAAIFLKDDARMPQRQGAYDSSLEAFKTEDASRAIDRNIVFA